MQNLAQYRHQLDKINHQLFDVLNARQELIHKIMMHKLEGNINSWDQKREAELYQLFQKNFADLNLDMLLMMSILLENQAGKYSDYPKWSRGEHLKNAPKNITEMINPVFLKMYNKDLYESISIKKEYEV